MKTVHGCLILRVPWDYTFNSSCFRKALHSPPLEISVRPPPYHHSGGVKVRRLGGVAQSPPSCFINHGNIMLDAMGCVPQKSKKIGRPLKTTAHQYQLCMAPLIRTLKDTVSSFSPEFVSNCVLPCLVFVLKFCREADAINVVLPCGADPKFIGERSSGYEGQSLSIGKRGTAQAIDRVVSQGHNGPLFKTLRQYSSLQSLCLQVTFPPSLRASSTLARIGLRWHSLIDRCGLANIQLTSELLACAEGHSSRYSWERALVGARVTYCASELERASALLLKHSQVADVGQGFKL
ncbi:hypothetical protein EDB19DRAFT_1837585 [Suillus lakei]|nr:hypothetical protein EDB19DRAFT_1837585 [Suillus lakei]